MLRMKKRGIHEEDGVFLFAKEKSEVIERERDLCGYFVIVTSKKMSAREALKDERKKLETKPNYMTVPASIRELEKIEMVRGLDGRYRMDHAVTATQKTILSAFRMDAKTVKNRANEISELLAGIEE